MAWFAHLRKTDEQRQCRKPELTVITDDGLGSGAGQLSRTRKQGEPLRPPGLVRSPRERPELRQPACDAFGARVIDVVMGEHVYAWRERLTPHRNAIPRHHGGALRRNIDECERGRLRTIINSAAAHSVENERAARREPSRGLRHVGRPVEHHREPAALVRGGQPGAVRAAIPHPNRGRVVAGPPRSRWIPRTMWVFVSHREHTGRARGVTRDFNDDCAHAPSVVRLGHPAAPKARRWCEDGAVKNIVLGVSGGIAAYKAVALARLLVEAGHDVHVVPTADALRFVGKPTWEAISRHPVTTSVHDDVPEVRHVALGQRADLVIVAPATANTLARMTAGLADDLLGTTLLATRAPVLVAPAMHTEMWQHPATSDNVAILRTRGVEFVGPDAGRLTGDDSGPGRMSEPATIFGRVQELLDAAPAASVADSGSDSVIGSDSDSDIARDIDSDIDNDGPGEREDNSPAAPAPAAAASWPANKAASGIGAHPTTPLDTADRARGDLAGTRVLVTAGGTREPIDPVRYLGNRSSGRQGVAIALAAADRGAEVVLLAANIDDAVLAQATADPAVRVVPVGTAAELDTTAHAAARGARVVIMAAAVADYRVAEIADAKLRKEDTGGRPPTLTLVENPDILVSLVRERQDGQVLVGFAAETVDSEEELLERGRRKLARKGVDLLAVNAVGWNEGFESDDNEVRVLDMDGDVVIAAAGSKRDVADALLDAVRDELDFTESALVD